MYRRYINKFIYLSIYLRTERHIDRFSRFCSTHAGDQRTHCDADHARSVCSRGPRHILRIAVRSTGKPVYVVSRAPASLYMQPKRHLDRFIRFCKVHASDQQTHSAACLAITPRRLCCSLRCGLKRGSRRHVLSNLLSSTRDECFITFKMFFFSICSVFKKFFFQHFCVCG